ncbi:MAG: hypothetical protein ABFR47_08175 [Verrucomicrobiota bacterium]
MTGSFQLLKNNPVENILRQEATMVFLNLLQGRLDASAVRTAAILAALLACDK